MDNQAPAPLLPRHCRRGGRQPPSCTQCQQRKIKCDRKLPCNRCTRGRRAGACVYTTAGVSATAASSTTNRLGRNRDAAEAGQSQVARVADPAAVSGPESCGAASYGQAEEAAGVDVVLLAKRVEELENRLEELSAAHRAEPAADVVTEQCLFRKGRVFGRSHLMHTLDQFPGIVKLDKARQEDLEIRNALEKCEKLEKEARARRDARERCESRVPLRELIPSREVSDELVQAYLRTTEPVLRVIHSPSFMSQYKQYWEIPQPSNEVFIAKLLLVLAIGTCFSRQEAFAPLRSSATRWICAVQGWVKSSAWESRITLSCVQFHCLLLIARQTCCVGKKQLWASASSLLQTAMELGLHRSPRFIPEVDIFEAEMRRRLWATVAELLVQTSIDAGTAPMLSSDDFDCEPPSNIDDHQLHESSVALPTPKPMNHFTETTTQILLQRSLPVRLEIARYLNHFRSDGSYSTALRLHAELSHVLGSHARLLDLASHPTASFIFHKKLFTLLTHRFFIALHQLFALRAPKDATFCISRTVCFSSSVLLLSLAQPSSPAPDLPIDTNAATASAFVSSQSSSSSRSARAPSSTDQWSDDFARLMCRGSGMFGEATLRAAIAVGFEVVVQHRQRNRQHVATYNRPETQASGLGDTEAEAEDKGRQAVEEFVSLSMERIRIVGDLFKSNLLFVVILAMVNSSEGEEEARVKFVMRENLRFWLEVLKERVEEFSEGVVRGGLGSQTSVAAGNVWTGETEVVQDDQGGNGMPAEGAGDFQWFGMDSDIGFNFDFTNAAQVMQSFDGLY